MAGIPDIESFSENTRNHVYIGLMQNPAKYMSVTSWSVLLIVFAFPSYVAASENIRVLIAERLRTVTIESRSGLVLEQPGRTLAGKKIVIGADSIGTRPLRLGSEAGDIRVGGREYRGVIEVRLDRHGLLQVINDLDIEDYLMGVVSEEIPHDWELDAVKAQAVASRTYAIYQKRLAGRRPYHITATVNTQVYGGRRSERESTTRAVRETRGLVIVYKGKAIPAFYHSSCGGQTEDASQLWNIDAPYLKGVDCSCQEISKYGAWERRFNIKDIMSALGGIGIQARDINSIEIGRITKAGRVKDLYIRHGEGVTSVSAERLRSALGYGAIPSVFFELSLSNGEFVLSGRGMGHGVGLCQWGARDMARRGHDFLSILGHYYPGTETARL